jgi:ABC-type sugar transport system, periplasmic component
MRKPRTTTAPAVLTLAVAATLLVGCSTGEPAVDPDAPVTITISNKPPAERAEELAAFEARVAEFEEANPNITVEATETVWDAQTFQALLAGGELPTTLVVPFTEPQAMIARGQVADITDELAEVGLTDLLNPAALTVAQDADGAVYGVPIDAYALGLVYNRALFEAAGLDPDVPPATWDEVQEFAARITEATGVAGYSQMTTGNTGGWMFSAITYAHGGTVQSADGTESTFDDAPAREQLERLHDMRWNDQSMGSNFLYDMASISQEFAAGRIGMFVGAPANYIFATLLNGMDPAEFGMGPMPQGPDAGGTMSGGAVQVVSPDATPEQQLAAVKWFAFSLEASTNEEKAVAAAKTSFEAGLPVGLPGLSSLKDDDYQRFLGWIEEYINVPLENFAPYTETVNTIELTPEPVAKAQEVYAALDSVVQAVLTDEGADIDALLADATRNVNALLSR